MACGPAQRTSGRDSEIDADRASSVPSPDFRAGLYLNAGLLSAAAASAILLARRIRGRTSLIDVVLPLSMLTLGQWQCLMISFALNLVMTSCISWSLHRYRRPLVQVTDSRLCFLIGGLLVLLPLCGGSGLVMVPPLALWLAGYVACGWWSGRDPGPSARAISLGLLMILTAIVTWYLCGYVKPARTRPLPRCWRFGRRPSRHSA